MDLVARGAVAAAAARGARIRHPTSVDLLEAPQAGFGERLAPAQDVHHLRPSGDEVEGGDSEARRSVAVAVGHLSLRDWIGGALYYVNFQNAGGERLSA